MGEKATSPTFSSSSIGKQRLVLPRHHRVAVSTAVTGQTAWARRR